MPNKRSVILLGVPFLPMTRAEARARLVRLCRGNRAARVMTPNPEILLRASRDPRLKETLLCADLLLPDGIGVLVGARLVGASLPERLTGIDTAEWLLSYAAKKGLSVFLLGGDIGVAEAAASALCARFAGLLICGTHHGYFDKCADSPENEALLGLLRSAEPQILFVCLGSPAQERWISENADRIPSLRLSIGLGGALDVWSGKVKRAPKIFQRCGAEWLWRGLSHPRRLKRLRAIPQFLWAVCRSKKRSL